MKTLKIFLFGLVLIAAPYSAFTQDNEVVALTVENSDTNLAKNEPSTQSEFVDGGNVDIEDAGLSTLASQIPQGFDGIENLGLNQQAIAEMINEAEQWKFMEAYFAANLNSLKFHQKFGCFLNNYSTYILMPVVMLGSFVICLFLEENININAKAKSASRNLFGFKNSVFGYNRTLENAFFKLEKGLIFATDVIVVPGAIFLVTNKILQFVGKKIENKDGRCLDLLTKFVNDWKRNRVLTPSFLRPMFDKLATGDRLAKIDKNTARQIVELIVAATLVVNSIN